MSDFGMVNVRLVPDYNTLSQKEITSPKDAVEYLVEELKGYDREVFCVVNVNTQGIPINANIVSMGSLNEAAIHPRELFKSSILSNAAAVILAHNHPSGVITPSSTDIETTERLCAAGIVLGIPVVDHIVIGHSKQYYSFAEKNKLENNPDYTKYLDYFDVEQNNFMKLVSQEKDGRETSLLVNRVTGSFITAKDYSEKTGDFSFDERFARTPKGLFQATSKLVTNEDKKEIFHQLPYEEKFKALLETEFPVLKENKKLMDEIYNGFIDDDGYVGLINTELYVSVSSKIKLDNLIKKRTK